MSDVTGNVLIEIQPDFSKFEAELTRGLVLAAQKAQKNAEIQMSVAIDSRKANQQVVGMVKSTTDMSTAFERLNANLERTANALEQMAQRQNQQRQRQRENTREVKEAAKAYDSFFEKMGKLAPLVQAAVTIDQITKNIKGFVELRAKASGFLSGLVESFRGTGTETSRFGEFLQRASERTKDFFSVVDHSIGNTKRVTEEIRGFTKEGKAYVDTIVTTTSNQANGIVRIHEQITRTSEGQSKILKDSTKDIEDFTREVKGGLGAVVGVVQEGRNAGQAAGATWQNWAKQGQDTANKAVGSFNRIKKSVQQSTSSQVIGINRSAASFKDLTENIDTNLGSVEDAASGSNQLNTVLNGLTRTTQRLIPAKRQVSAATTATADNYTREARTAAQAQTRTIGLVSAYASLAARLKDVTNSTTQKRKSDSLNNTLQTKANDLFTKGGGVLSRFKGHIQTAAEAVHGLSTRLRNISLGIKENSIVFQAHNAVTTTATNSSHALGTALLALRARAMQNTAVTGVQAKATEKLTQAKGLLGAKVDALGGIYEKAAAPVKDFGTGLGTIVGGVVKVGQASEKTKEKVGGLKGAFADVQGEILKLRGRFQEMEKSSNLVTRAIGFVGVKLTSVTGLAAVAATALGTVVKSMSSTIVGLAQGASNLAEAENALSVTLGEADKPFRELIGDTTKLGMTQLDLNEAIVPIIPLMKNAGFAGEEFANKLNLLVRRGVDIGSIMNKQTKDVLPALGAALRGEIDPAERLGISFNAMAVEAKAVELGFKKVGGEFEESAKVQARLALVMQKSEVFAGDYARTSDQLANATRNYHSVVAGLRLEFSKAFLPAANAILKAQNELVTAVGPAVASLFAKLQPLVTAVGAVLAALTQTLKIVITTFMDVYGVIGDGITAVLEPAIGAVQTFAKAYEPLIDKLQTVMKVAGAFAKITLTAGVALIAVHRIIGLVISSLNLASMAMLRFGQASAAANMQAMAGRLSSISTAVTGVVAGIITMIVRLNQLKAETKAAAEGIKEDFRDTSDIHALGSAVGAVGTKIQEAKDDLSGGFQIKIGGFRIKPFKDVNLQTERLAAREKELVSLQDKLNQQQDVLGQVSKRTGETVEQVFKRASEAGIDFMNLPAEKKVQTIDSLIKGMDQSARQLQNALDHIKSATKNLADYETAVKATGEAEKELKKLEADRKKLVNDVTAIKLEEWNATKAVRDAEKAIGDAVKQREAEQQRLVDIATERKDLEQQIADLLKPPDPADVEAAQDAIIRAEIELARQNRRQLDLEEKKTDEVKEQTKELKDQQKVQVDLRGLNLDQIKGRLISLNAQLAAERAVTKDKEEEEDIQEDITEETSDQLTLAEQQKLLDIDRRAAARDLKDRQEELNALVNTHITHATDVKGLQDRIAQLAKDEETAKTNIDQLEKDQPGLILAKESAEKNYQEIVLNKTEGIHGTIKQLNQDILDKKEEIRLKEGEEQTALDNLKRTEEEILAIQQRKTMEKLKELGIVNEEIKTLSANAKSEAFGVIRTAYLQSDWIKGLSGPMQRQVREDANFEVEAILNKPGFMEALVAGMVINPDVDIRELLKQLFKEFGITSVKLAQGGVVQQHTIAQIGEGGLAEAVLPLTKPERFAAVLKQATPYAHPQIQQMIGQLDRDSFRAGASYSLSSKGASITTSRKPSRIEQKLDRMIQLLEADKEQKVAVDAPITINTKDSSRAVRQSVRELERRLRRL